MKVLIIGGGASGLMAALSAAEDGANRVTLLERQGRPAPAFVMDPEVTYFYRFTRDSFRLEGYDPLPFDEKIPVAI